MCSKRIFRVASIVLVLTFLCCVPTLAAGTTGDVAGAANSEVLDINGIALAVVLKKVQA